MAFGLRVGADRPPQAAEPTHDFLTVKSRLRELRKHYLSLSRPEIAQVAYRTIDNLSDRVLRLFGNFGGENSNLVKTHSGPSSAEQAYLSLKETARIAESNGDRASAAAIRQRLGVVDEFAGQQLQAFCDKHNVAATSLAPALPQSPPKAAAKVPIQAIDPRNLSLSPFDWVKFYRQLDQVSRHFRRAGQPAAYIDFRDAHSRASERTRHFFRKHEGQLANLPGLGADATCRAEQYYRAMEEMMRRAEASGEYLLQYKIRESLQSLHQWASNTGDNLSTKYGYGSLEDMAQFAMQSPLPAPAIHAPVSAPGQGSAHVHTASGTSVQPGALQPSVSSVATAKPVATPVNFTPGSRPAHPARAQAPVTQRLESTVPSPGSIPGPPRQVPSDLEDDFAVEREGIPLAGTKA